MYISISNISNHSFNSLVTPSCDLAFPYTDNPRGSITKWGKLKLTFWLFRMYAGPKGTKGRPIAQYVSNTDPYPVIFDVITAIHICI